jgi:hypothetical protein
MAHVNDCIPGSKARVNHSGVVRIVGKVGTIVEVTRVKRRAADPLKDTVTVDIPGHGEVAVTPDDLEIVA